MATATSLAVTEVDEIAADQDQHQLQQVLSTNDMKVDETDDKTQSKQTEDCAEQVARQSDDAADIIDQTPMSAMEVDDSQTQPQQDEYPTGFKFLVTSMAAFVLLTLLGLDFNVVSTAVPAITTEFQTIADVGWYSSGFRLTACAFQFMFGKLYSIFSVKHLLLVSIVIFGIGSLLSGAAVTSAMLVLGRAFSGLGTAGVISGLFLMITLCIPLRHRPAAGAFASGFEGVAAAIAPLIGGALTDRVSWRWCFYVNLPLIAVAFIVLAIFFENPQQSDNALKHLPLKQKLRKLDLLGTAFFVPSITLVLLGLQWGGSKYGWGDARIVVLLVLGVVLLVGFAIQQWRMGDDATLPRRIVANRSLLSGVWFSLCNNSALSVVDYYMPIYFQVVQGVTATKSGIMCLPIAIGLYVALALSGPATSMFGYYTPSMIVTSILAPVAAGLLTTIQVDTPIARLIAYQALLGFAVGVGFQGPQSAVQTVFNVHDVPLAIAVVVFAQNFGPALFVPVAQTIFAGRLEDYLARFLSESKNSSSSSNNSNAGSGTTALGIMGLLDLRDWVPVQELPQALLGYDMAVTQTFFLVVTLTCATLAGTLGMEWRSVKQKRS